MSELMLTVRDAKRAIHGRTHASCVDVVLAALSADPETIDELQAAMGRFMKPTAEERAFFEAWNAGTCDEPWDAGVCIVDLAARLAVMQSAASEQLRRGQVLYLDGNAEEETWVPYCIADDWELTDDVEDWQSLAAERRSERAADPPFDAREVLYGKVCEFIARECLPIAADMREADDAIRDIHARWLTAPRDDLSGQSPRDVLLARKEHIDLDVQDRAEQWTMLNECPPPLRRETAAFRFAGFGTQEIVVYYYLVRELLWNCRQHAAEQRPGKRAKKARRPIPLPIEADRLTAEIARLEQVRDEWLHAPNFEEFSGHVPADVIELERQRLPAGVTGHEAMIDDDCPLCQMMADEAGPVFWSLDGCNMDDDFAFSFHRTRAEWDEEQRRWEEFNRKFEAEERQRRLTALESEHVASVWNASFSSADVPEDVALPLEIRLFKIGAHLAELTQDLKDVRDKGGFIDLLNRHFGNLRDAARDPSEALLDPVVQRFCQDLQLLGDAHPDLCDKTDDLERQLTQLTRPLFTPPEWDDDVPF